MVIQAGYTVTLQLPNSNSLSDTSLLNDLKILVFCATPSYESGSMITINLQSDVGVMPMGLYMIDPSVWQQHQGQPFVIKVAYGLYGEDFRWFATGDFQG